MEYSRKIENGKIIFRQKIIDEFLKIKLENFGNIKKYNKVLHQLKKIDIAMSNLFAKLISDFINRERMDFHYITGLFQNSNLNYNGFPPIIEEFSFIIDEVTFDEGAFDENWIVNEFWRDFDKRVSRTRSSRENKLEKMIQNKQNSLSLRYKYSDPAHQFSNKIDTSMSYLMREVRKNYSLKNKKLLFMKIQEKIGKRFLLKKIQIYIFVS